MFEEPIAFGVDAAPNFVVNTNLNNDGVFDLVTVNADDGETGGSVTALINIQPSRWSAERAQLHGDQGWL